MLSVAKYLNRRSFLRGAARAGLALPLSAISVEAFAVAAPDLKKLITQYYAAYEELNLEKALSFYAEDAYFEDPTIHMILRNRKEMHDAFAAIKPLYQRVKFEPSLLLVSGAWLICQHVQSGSLRRSAQAEFKDYRVQGVSLFEFAGEKIKRQYDYYDALGLRKQTGATGSAQ